MVEKLRNHLNSITQEEFDIEWEEIEKMGFEGITIEEFLNPNKKLLNHLGSLLLIMEEFLPIDHPLIRNNHFKYLKKLFDENNT